jgi:hypothetical protein
MKMSISRKIIYCCFVFLLIFCKKQEEAIPETRLELKSVLYDAVQKDVKIIGIVLAPSDSEVGFVYGTKSNPTIENSKVIAYQSDGSVQDITRTLALEVKIGEKYYVRLYSKNNEKIEYSNEQVVINSPNWERLPDVPYTGTPLPEASLSSYSFGNTIFYSINVRTRTPNNEDATSKGFYYGSGQKEWVGDRESRLLINPIYLRAPAESRSFGGAGYFYFPEKNPTYEYNKRFADFLPRSEVDNYPGADAPTVNFATEGQYPDLFVLEVGKGFNLWSFSRTKIDPVGWVKLRAYPIRNGLKLLACTIKNNGYVLAEDTKEFFRYNIQTDEWQALKNIPFPDREAGIFFVFEGIGYYGLGNNIKTGEGYKDIWKYNDQTDSWQMAYEYPGSGNVGVAVAGEYTKIFLGMGYQAVPTNLKTSKYYPAKDFWEFKPNK